MRRALIAIVLAAIALALVPGAAWSLSVEQDRDEVLDYWTPARMAAAKPAELLVEPAARSVSPQARAAEADGARYAVANPSEPGLRTHGKLYITIPELGDFVCSATVAESFSHSLVTTAGHCVSDGRDFATNWMFVPAYEEGRAPFGRWTATRLEATQGWKQDEDLRFDVGMALVERGAGERIEDVVGARTIDFNRPRNLFYNSFGYPADQPPFEFSGEREFGCASSWRGDDQALSSPRPMRIACDMTAGSSGGGWIVDGTLLSVNSFKAGVILVPDSRYMYGPYFGDEVADLYAALGGGPALCAEEKAALAEARRAVTAARERLAKARARKRAADTPRARQRASRRIERRLAALEARKDERAAQKADYDACLAGQFS